MPHLFGSTIIIFALYDSLFDNKNITEFDTEIKQVAVLKNHAPEQGNIKRNFNEVFQNNTKPSVDENGVSDLAFFEKNHDKIKTPTQEYRLFETGR